MYAEQYTVLSLVLHREFSLPGAFWAEGSLRFARTKGGLQFPQVGQHGCGVTTVQPGALDEINPGLLRHNNIAVHHGHAERSQIVEVTGLSWDLRVGVAQQLKFIDHMTTRNVSYERGHGI